MNKKTKPGAAEYPAAALKAAYDHGYRDARARIAELEAQLKEANHEREYERAWKETNQGLAAGLQGLFDKAATRAEAAESERDRLRKALEEYAKEENWHSCDSQSTGDPKRDFLYWKDGRDWAGYEIAQAALGGETK